MLRCDLKKSSMMFKTEKGDLFIISKEDVTEITNKILIESMINEKSQFYMMKEQKIEKANLLYKIVIEQSHKMTKTTRNTYLKSIIDVFKT